MFSPFAILGIWFTGFVISVHIQEIKNRTKIVTHLNHVGPDSRGRREYEQVTRPMRNWENFNIIQPMIWPLMILMPSLNKVWKLLSSIGDRIKGIASKVYAKYNSLLDDQAKKIILKSETPEDEQNNKRRKRK